jgi:3-oxoacyl-[acyl-carrier protein] reductase
LIDTTPPLAGQVAVVTGAGRGIGAAVARQLAVLGANVALCGRTQSTLQQTADSISESGGKTEIVPCDVTVLHQLQHAAARIQSTLGRVDILINNAGIAGPMGPLHDLPPDEWERILNTNLRSVYFAIRSFAPLMIRAQSGHIINISSLAGKNPLAYGAAYAASKWGLNGLTYSIAEELRQHKIRVSVLCPGSVDTEFGPHEGKDRAKMLQPDDVAHAVIMLVTQAPQSFMSEVLMRPTQKP